MASQRRGSNPLVRLFSGSPCSSREDLGLTKTTLRLVPTVSTPPVMGGTPLTSASTGPSMPTTSFAVFQAKMLTLEYDEDQLSVDNDPQLKRVAYAPVKLPRPPIPRIKFTEADNIPFELKEEDILPEWRDPPRRVTKRRTWEEDLEMARKVWRRSTGLSFIEGEPEVLDTRKITDEELEVSEALDWTTDEFRIGEEEVLSISERRRDVASFIPGEPEVLQVRRIAEDELHMGGYGTQRMPETPPDSPMDYILYDVDRHKRMSHASMSCYSPMSSIYSEAMIEGAGLVRKHTIPRSTSSAAANSRKNSLTRSPSVRSRNRSGSNASQRSVREQELGGNSHVRRISTDFSAGMADYGGISDSRLLAADQSGSLPTPPISPPTPTVPSGDAQSTVASYLKNSHHAAAGVQYSPVGTNPYSDERSPSIGPSTATYQYAAFRPKPYDPEVESVVSDVSSSTDVASLSSFSVSSGSLPSRSASLSSPTRRSSLIARNGSAGWGSIAEETGEYQEIGGYPMTGRAGYSNGEYYYQQYRLQQLDDLRALGTAQQQQVESSHRDGLEDKPKLSKIVEVDKAVERIYSLEIDAKRRSREVVRKALPKSPGNRISATLGQPSVIQRTAEDPSSPTDSMISDQLVAEHIEGEYDGQLDAGEEEEDEEDEEGEDKQAEARFRRMREIALQLQEEEERKEREREMQKAAKAVGNTRVNVIKRKPVMNMATAAGGVV